MSRLTLLAAASLLPLVATGCRSLAKQPSAEIIGGARHATPSRDAPKVRPDDDEWRRKPYPFPPVYLSFTSGSGNRWRMITPLYWQVKGKHSERHTVPAVMTYHADRPSDSTSGHVLNWFWKSTPKESWGVFFPLAWHFESPEADTALWGPLYSRTEHTGDRRERVLFPGVYSSERDDTGYEYWSVLLRLIGYERQVFDGEQCARVWFLFFCYAYID